MEHIRVERDDRLRNALQKVGRKSRGAQAQIVASLRYVDDRAGKQHDQVVFDDLVDFQAHSTSAPPPSRTGRSNGSSPFHPSSETAKLAVMYPPLSCRASWAMRTVGSAVFFAIGGTFVKLETNRNKGSHTVAELQAERKPENDF